MAHVARPQKRFWAGNVDRAFGGPVVRGSGGGRSQLTRLGPAPPEKVSDRLTTKSATPSKTSPPHPIEKYATPL